MPEAAMDVFTAVFRAGARPAQVLDNGTLLAPLLRLAFEPICR